MNPAVADNVFGGDEGKFLLTAGFSDLEGAGGGGLVPLALISGYGSQNSWGANAHFTSIQLHDFTLRAYGVTVAALDRVELSYTRQLFDVTSAPLDGLGVTQDIVSLKIKLLGDAVYSAKPPAGTTPGWFGWSGRRMIRTGTIILRQEKSHGNPR